MSPKTFFEKRLTWQEAEHAYEHYLYFRIIKKLGVAEAYQKSMAMPFTYIKGAGYYGQPKAGAFFEVKFNKQARWMDAEALGLRFLGWADEIAQRSIDHTGWFTNEDASMKLRGGVWQASAKDGRSRLVYGYGDFERGAEVNPGHVVIVEDVRMLGASERVSLLAGTDTAIKCAKDADRVAERQAEDQREYNEAYYSGQVAGEADNEAGDEWKEVRDIVRELRVNRALAPLSPIAHGIIRDVLSRKIQDIHALRVKRDKAWREVCKGDREAWLCGFTDAASRDRAIQLGYCQPEIAAVS